MEKHKIKCNCNCHSEQFRKDVGIEEHSDCSLCFQELFIEAQEINQYMKMENKILYYKVQIGKGKGSYRTKYTLYNQPQALRYYSGINVGNGYKKRLVEVYENCTNIVLREFS